MAVMSDGFKVKIDGKTKDAEKVFLYVEVKVLMLAMAVMFHGFTVKVDGRMKDAENTSFICGGQSVNVFYGRYV